MLDRNRFIIKEQVTMIKTTDTYDIIDPDTEKQIGQAKEVPGMLVAGLRWIIDKNWMPTRIEIRDRKDNLIFYMRRGWYMFRAKVRVYNADDELIGWFRSKFLSIAGAFQVYDKNDELFAQVKGGRRWFFDYHLKTPDGIEIGSVTKKFGGVLKELFTSSDTFLVTVGDDFEEDNVAKILVLAAALVVDMVFKEDTSAGISQIPDITD
jgi:Scramblase